MTTYTYLVKSIGHAPQASAIEVERSGAVGATIALARVLERFSGYAVHEITIDGNGVTITVEVSP